jgi:Protein of unknown function (DUF2934)
MKVTPLDSVPEGLKNDGMKPRAAPVSPQERQRWIEEAAYYRAQRRGFDPDQSWSDWFDAEQEIDDSISRLPPDRA